MADDPKLFYDRLAANYHLIFEDWQASIDRQASILAPILERECGGASSTRILDCACGIGTQSLGLASHGFSVTGCDFSSASIERLRSESTRRGLSIPSFVADMRDLSSVPGRDFDAVICMDNALPHLEDDEQLLQALLQIRGKLSYNKPLVASLRDYDRLLRERPVVQEPVFYRGNGRRRIVHQIWDWIDDRRYSFHLYITCETEQGWENQHYVSYYRALLRHELASLLQTAGFSNTRWLFPAESGFYQPIVLATAA